jgi:hypothetical protein
VCVCDYYWCSRVRESSSLRVTLDSYEVLLPQKGRGVSLLWEVREGACVEKVFLGFVQESAGVCL